MVRTKNSHTQASVENKLKKVGKKKLEESTTLLQKWQDQSAVTFTLYKVNNIFLFHF